YHQLENELGKTFFAHDNANATYQQKEVLLKFSSQQVKTTELAGEKIETMLTFAPGDHAPIGGLKVISNGGWFAVRPSGTEAIYEIYAESFRDVNHLQRILNEAQTIVNTVFAAMPVLDNVNNEK
ncbi:MAG TPA: alpha-D-glucose phosphate-specific phosphoglucomutase, partial [Gammaproteobacteria bacterium]|nr:alpha-D-glucose phosphate-specific phosphoglucomutase [Gammaproteobacteria bacterium]